MFLGGSPIKRETNNLDTGRSLLFLLSHCPMLAGDTQQLCAYGLETSV